MEFWSRFPMAKCTLICQLWMLKRQSRSVRDEYKEFEKVIQDDLKEVDNRFEEEDQIDAAEAIEEKKTVEHITYIERIEMLKRKRMELAASRSLLNLMEIHQMLSARKTSLSKMSHQVKTKMMKASPSIMSLLSWSYKIGYASFSYYYC